MAFPLALLSAAAAWALALGLARWGRFLVFDIRNPLPGDSTRLWLLWWGLLFGLSGFAAWAIGHPLVGLLGAVFFPAFGLFLSRRRRHFTALELEDSALVFFRGLQGLLKAGFSLPVSLFRLCQSVDSAFARRLRRSLEGFDRGRSLSECLGRFRHRTGLSQAGLCLDVLERAHGRGLSLGPFLDRVLPWLESEARDRKRIDEARKSALAQACLASLLPWAVAAFASGSFRGPGWFGVAALGIQAAGFFTVGKIARFE